MMLIKILVLVCPITMAPADCQPDQETVSVIRSPEVAHNEMMCGRYGQAQLASVHNLIDFKTQYPKVVCVPVRERAANGAIFEK